MPTPDRPQSIASISAYVSESDKHEATLDELKGDLAALVTDVKSIVDARTHRAQQAANAGVDMTRDTIRANPIASLAIATAAGAAVALLLLPASRPGRSLSNIRDWAPRLTRSDLQEMIGSVRHTAEKTAAGIPLLSVFERVVDSVSAIDPKTSLTPALEKAGAWLASLRGAMSSGK